MIYVSAFTIDTRISQVVNLTDRADSLAPRRASDLSRFRSVTATAQDTMNRADIVLCENNTRYTMLYCRTFDWNGEIIYHEK